mmetsp:Transcript_11069/g.33044  ORF Transcript_11069/g.33044 Transcript_11069/m.33044 type:complete len:294 (+) Transcript_11069:1004-1885(+)
MMAWFAGVRRSMTRWLRRVSRPTTTSPSFGSFSFRDASTIWKGRSGAALETTKTLVRESSTSLWEQPETAAGARVPSTSTMDSEGILARNATSVLSTRGASATHCTVKQPWRSTAKARLPLPRTACTRPRAHTLAPARAADSSRTCVQRRPVMVRDMMTPRSPKAASVSAATGADAAAAFLARSAMRSSFLDGFCSLGAAAASFFFFFLSTIASGCAGSSAVSSCFSARSTATASLMAAGSALLDLRPLTTSPCAPIFCSSSAREAMAAAALPCSCLCGGCGGAARVRRRVRA